MSDEEFNDGPSYGCPTSRITEGDLVAYMALERETADAAAHVGVLRDRGYGSNLVKIRGHFTAHFRRCEPCRAEYDELVQDQRFISRGLTEPDGDDTQPDI